ncbi:hypothetical protein lerEdw1_005473 [Lerista edwardsae]|nr:hypothetical protein lerEdw1_005473 [Lerista edwardsae]
MTILPKKKPCPAAGDGDRDQPGSRGGGPGGPGGPGGVGGSDPRGCSGADSHPRGSGGGVGGGVGPGEAHSGRGGARPRASPPPPPPRWGLPSAGSPPPPNPGVGAGGDGPGLGLLDPGVGEARGGVGGGCCSGPGHSKRRRQGGPAGGLGLGGAAGPGGGGGNSPEQDEAGAGYNSEDEYETAAARIESMDPATVEQQEHRFEKALREKKGFIIKQMKEDGACLFRAVDLRNDSLQILEMFDPRFPLAKLLVAGDLNPRVGSELDLQAWDLHEETSVPDYCLSVAKIF